MLTADQVNRRILGRLDELATGDQEPSVPDDVLRFEAEQAALDVLTHAPLRGVHGGRSPPWVVT